MTVIVNNTGFNIEYWARFTIQEFIEHGLKYRLFKGLPDKDRRELLLQVYKIIKEYAK